ncbi:DUF378 domain-containing protein [Acetobacteraceae bacterium]|nr:DUF378 domain-containing protein [Candidatus Parcubacteria bacterium]
MKIVELIGYWLVVIGGVTWGLVGLSMLISGDMSWNIVNILLGSWPMVEAVVYVLVGLSAVWMLVMTKGKPAATSSM